MAEANKTSKQAAPAQSQSKKQVEEDSDFYVAFITKKKRNIEKKLKEIKDLESRESKTLNEDQKNKIKSKSECEDRIKQFDEMVKMYNAAKKENTQVTNKVTEAPTKKPAEKTDNVAEQVLALSRVSDFLKNDHNKEKISWGLKVDRELLQALSNLGSNIFNLPCSSSETLSVLHQASLKKLNLYLACSHDLTADGKSYQDYHELVDRIIHSEHYTTAKIVAQPQRQPVEEKKQTQTHAETQAKPSQMESPPKQAAALIETPVKQPPPHVEVQPVAEEKKQPEPEVTQKAEPVQEKTSKLYHESDEEHEEVRPQKNENRGQRKQHGGKKGEVNEDNDGFITFERKKKFGDDGYRGRYGGKGYGSKQGQKGYALGGRRPHYNNEPKYSKKDQYEPKSSQQQQEDNEQSVTIHYYLQLQVFKNLLVNSTNILVNIQIIFQLKIYACWHFDNKIYINKYNIKHLKHSC